IILLTDSYALDNCFVRNLIIKNTALGLRIPNVNFTVFTAADNEVTLLILKILKINQIVLVGMAGVGSEDGGGIPLPQVKFRVQR
ncbi:MAG: hypothetical protein ACK559_22610, partial [bacterium]